MSYRIVLTPEAEAQLDSLHDYIAGETSPEVATCEARTSFLAVAHVPYSFYGHVRLVIARRCSGDS